MKTLYALASEAGLCAIAIGIVACGGPKETINQQPDPFPAPPVVEEAPRVVVPEKPKVAATPDPSDLQKRDPLVLETVYFDFDKSALTDGAKELLAQNAKVMQQYPLVNIRIEGHCDERGTVEYNLALGEKRAIATRNYLINFGISPGRMTIISYGKERPADPRHMPAAWDKNRRSEFVILTR